MPIQATSCWNWLQAPATGTGLQQNWEIVNYKDVRQEKEDYQCSLISQFTVRFTLDFQQLLISNHNSVFPPRRP